MTNVLYIHGMGGGGDSRIPSILKDRIGRYVPETDSVNIVVRTYDFDPETAHAQIVSWMDELKPVLVIGESLGALHALRVTGIPHLFVSPALNTPLFFRYMAWMTFLPGVTGMLDRMYRPKDGDRQKLHFTYNVLRKYGKHRKMAIRNSAVARKSDMYFAFFGVHDHYRKSGIVSVRTWKKYFGDSYMMYDGTHFMEEEFIDSMLMPKILEVLVHKQ
ncbi:MAG: hypothetical protein K2G18_02440 [Bacteroidales bacterium]|nr:hypothetical protein [Bacteroidales bacterium]